MRRQLLPALRMLVLLTLVTGLAYPFAVTGVAQALMGHRAGGSLIRDRAGAVVGSSLIGQPFSGARWFHPRPSAAGDGYDPRSSGPTNLGPTDPGLLHAVQTRVIAYRRENGLGTGVRVPVDAVTSSGSGLDPHISVRNAQLQAPRVARVRHLPLERVLALIDRHTDGRTLGFLGEPGVNVVELNLALADG